MTFEWPVMLVQVDCLLPMLVHHCLPHCQRSIPLPAVPSMVGHLVKLSDQNEGLDFGVLVHLHSLEGVICQLVIAQKVWRMCEGSQWGW